LDIVTLAPIMSSSATFCVAVLIYLQLREQRRARNDPTRPLIIVDVDYSGRTTVNVVVRNIGGGAAKNLTFDFSAPVETSKGWDITQLPYFQNGVNFMAPNTDIVAVWDSFENVLQTLKDRDLQTGITITSYYQDLQGESYKTEWTINPLLLEGSGYFDYKNFEDQVQAAEDQARALERISECVEQAVKQRDASQAS
jgi:hypothetical protein